MVVAMTSMNLSVMLMSEKIGIYLVRKAFENLFVFMLFNRQIF